MPPFIPDAPLWEAVWAAGVFVVAIVIGWLVIGAIAGLVFSNVILRGKSWD